ncbi:insulin-degrading enzyme [Ilyonectria destructans]|nr:insulin-degrading enzyme [Ilyonectria destructans]
MEHFLFWCTKWLLGELYQSLELKVSWPYKGEHEYYLSAHSGSSNAYAGLTSTKCFFDIASPCDSNPSPLCEALDCFAQFFTAPLFLPSTLDRELKGVDSENKKNLQNDIWRLHQLEKSLSNPNHPYCHFSTGNFEVLKTLPEARNINVRGKVFEFHAKRYSVHRMKLVVLSREPLDVLQKWVVKFSLQLSTRSCPPTAREGFRRERFILFGGRKWRTQIAGGAYRDGNPITC